MSAETTVFAALSGAAGVTALVSSRIYPDLAPENAVLPLITYMRTASVPTYTIGSVLVATETTIAFACWSADARSAAEALADAAVGALSAAGIISKNREAHYNADTGAYAAVVYFQIWE